MDWTSIKTRIDRTSTKTRIITKQKERKIKRQTNLNRINLSHQTLSRRYVYKK